MPDPHALLDLPSFPAGRYAPLADRLKALLATRNDVVFVQGEAILALEAAATSLGRPGLVAVNVVTSPYGGYFGNWLQRAGATVHNVAAEAGQPIALDAVERALAGLPHVDLVSLVHAETSSGILNPLPGIAAAGRARDALLVVDAVASIGGHPLAVDALGIDVCIVGPQKALGGPAGLSMAAISARAWDFMAKKPHSEPDAPSSLSLPDLKANWLDTGRGIVPGMPSAIEFWALDAALDRVEAETLPALIARHRRAANAARAGVTALGASLWIADPANASTLATAVAVPPGIEAATLISRAQQFGAALSPGFGAVRDRLVRLDHTGARAAFAPVLTNIVAYGSALQALGVPANIGAAAEAVTAAYADP
jgi:aspartate aminotransferase-like enzyme